MPATMIPPPFGASEAYVPAMRSGAGVWRGADAEPVREGRKKVELSRTTLPIPRFMAVPEMVVVIPGVRV